MKGKGFTLIELIMVIVILGIVAAVAFPRYVDLTGTAKENATKASLAAIRAVVATKYAESILAESPAYPEITANLFEERNIPKEAYKKSNVITASNNSPIAEGDFDDSGGWIYNQNTGEIRANVSGGHAW